MHGDRTHGPSHPACLHERHDLGREGGERGQAAAESRRDDRPPLEGNGWVRRKNCDRYPDDIAADEIRGQSAGRYGRKISIEYQREEPAHETAQHAAHCHRHHRSPPCHIVTLALSRTNKYSGSPKRSSTLPHPTASLPAPMIAHSE